ncbi:MAG: pseudouridine synthase [Pseudomonadota bacterium]|nr:pseudouridine synthase [Pseudomonadota bacterium]
MSRAPRPATVPMRAGVSASCVAVSVGPWGDVARFMAQRLPALSLNEWRERMAAGDVLDESGQPVPPDAPCRPGQRLFYYRWQPDEPPPPAPERIVFQDEWLVVADKPHFMPVNPSGRFVQRSLLVRLKARLGIDTLSPLHRIDRDTAGLVAFAVQPHTRHAYQSLLRERRMHKLYEAVAPHRLGIAFPRTHTSRLEADPERFFISREMPGAPNSETRMAIAALLPAAPDGQPLALYHLHPITGRRHQLRLHMQSLGLPLLGDAFYPRVLRAPGEPDDTARPLQLLAREIAFDDPVTGQPRHFRSGLTLAATQGAWPPCLAS